MATLDIFTLLFFFFFFLPHIATTTPTTTCVLVTCGGPSVVRFPFRLQDYQPSPCGYPGFNFTCKINITPPWHAQTILTLPSSGDFNVVSINYRGQIVTIDDPNNCLAKRFLDHDVNITGSPFSHLVRLENYTFLNCSSTSQSTIFGFPIIYCLSGDNYKVISVPMTWLSPYRELWKSICTVISTAMVPNSFEWHSTGTLLTWNVPDCRSCEAVGLLCGLDHNATTTSLPIQCFAPPKPVQPFNVAISTLPVPGLSTASKYDDILIGTGIPALCCIIGIVLYVCDRKRARGRSDQPTTELSTTVSNRQPPGVTMGLDSHLISELSNMVLNQRPPVFITGLDSRTIESYPKTQLGETFELPDPNDNTCPICLCEYQPKETLRTIPQCNHYFHASCVDQWLGMNPTCPLCRNQQEGEKI